jgi:hypothetical protein
MSYNSPLMHRHGTHKNITCLATWFQGSDMPVVDT